MSEADSDEDDSSSLNLTSFLFGNIDKNGELADSDTFDADTLSKLRGLGAMLQDTGLTNIVQDDRRDNSVDDEDMEDNEVIKDPNAEDFSNFDEAISESDEEEDEAMDTSSAKEDDTVLMPPPPPPSSTTTTVSPSVAASSSSAQAVDKPAAPPLQTPLAMMLPEKLKNRKVTDFFPAFRENHVLKFSELFPIKESHKPRTWKSLKKRRQKLEKERKKLKREKKELREGGGEGAGGDGVASTSADDPPALTPDDDIMGDNQDNFDNTTQKHYGWGPHYAPEPEDPNLYEVDQQVLFSQPMQLNKPKAESPLKEEDQSKKGPKQTDWRWGPAQYWFDLVEVPADVDEYDYGLKTAEETKDHDNVKNEDNHKPEPKKEEHRPVLPDFSKPGSSGLQKPVLKEEDVKKIEYPDDAFHMVTQVNWEEDIIWNGEEIRHKVLSKLNSKANAAGWVPSSMNRTAVSFSQQRPGVKPELQIKLATMGKKLPTKDDDTWYSIFPVENEELVYGRWEDEVIWDSEAMPKKLKPNIVSLDPNDENIIIAIPDDIDPSTLPNEEPQRKIKIIQKHVKKSKLLLNKHGLISVVEEDAPPPPPKNDDRDPFYIGNDEFYEAKEAPSSIKVATAGTLLQHATPSVQLTAPFVPTHMGPIKLRQFHRWPLKRYSHGPLSNYLAFHGVQSLYKHQRKMEKWRTAEREEAGGGDIFLMREAKDVSGKDGDIILMEYIEEFPSFMSFVGMSSKLKNYYKKKLENDKGPPDLKYGTTHYAHTSPFLGTMIPGQMIQSIENKMYRAPIYPHKFPRTDFLIIRTRNEFSIREVNAYFITGQECPLYEVPGPNSKRANNFIRDFLQVFIYRLFSMSKSKDQYKRIKMDDIKKAFPSHSESSIRKRLKPCAEFRRTGPDSNWWVMKPGFRLPTEEEIREMVDPESCCAFYSMIAAEQRLKDAGYGDKFILAQDDDDENNIELKMDDEIKCAPWNTTRAYVQAMKGKCLLQLTGPADPTGPAKEGFSYVKIPNKPINKEEQEAQPKRTVTGTDADLRKLPLKDAKAILRKNGVPESEIKKLSRWEVIDVVRTLSTEKVKAGEEGADSFKFSRGNRYSIAEHQERYREDCQRIFEVQNKVLASDEVLSSDEGETSSEEEEEDDELDEMGKNIENMLSNKKTSKQYMNEREEIERKKLQKIMTENRSEEKKKKKEDEPEAINTNEQVLRITRTYKNAQGQQYTRTDLVRKSLVIETYVKIRSTKDDAFIRQFATMDDQVKEEMKKEKRRIQEQLRRIKRNQEREKQSSSKQQPVKVKKEKMRPDLKLKCGACGQTGHMRTNKTCPMFTGEEGEFNEPIDRKPILDENSMPIMDNDDLITSEGTKIKISEKAMKLAEEQRRRESMMMVSKENKTKEALKAQKRKRAGTGRHCDYLDRREYPTSKRARTDPVISFSIHLEDILTQIRNMGESQAFLHPVSAKAVPDYYEKVKIPMDLQTIRDKIQQQKYHTREEFLADINQIYENSVLYNGDPSIFSIQSKAILDCVVQRFCERENELMNLEKKINPLLDDNDLVSLSYIFSEIMEKTVKTMQESWPFMKPVNKKAVKDYYEKIKHPMDLETMTIKVKSRKYHSSHAFLADFEMIYTNSRMFNGEENEFTVKAQRMYEAVLDQLNKYTDHCTALESKIRDTQQRARERDEIDSLGGDFASGEGEEGRQRKKSGLDGDLEYSTDEDGWQDPDIPGPSNQPNNPFNITLADPNAAPTAFPGGIIIKPDPGNLGETLPVKSEPVDMTDYFQHQQLENAGPVFNIQTGQDGQFYAEGLQAANQNQEHAQQMYADSLQQAVAAAAAGQHQGEMYGEGMQRPAGDGLYAEGMDQQFSINQLNPVNIQNLQNMNLGAGFQFQDPGMQDQQQEDIPENYDPTAFLQDVVVPQMPRGDEDNLKDDLAVSDESEDEDKKPNISSDDALAF